MLSSFLAILGDSKYFSFFLFLWTATMEGGGVKNSNKCFIQFFHQFGQFGTLFIFSLSSQMFWTPTMERGVKNGERGAGGEIKRRRVDNLKFLGCYESLVY